MQLRTKNQHIYIYILTVHYIMYTLYTHQVSCTHHALYIGKTFSSTRSLAGVVAICSSRASKPFAVKQHLIVAGRALTRSYISSWWCPIASLTIVCVQACFIPVCPCCCLIQCFLPCDNFPLQDNDSLAIFNANGACISCIFLRLISCLTSAVGFHFSSIRSSCHVHKIWRFCLVFFSIACCPSCLCQDIILFLLLLLHQDLLSVSS